MPEASPPVAGDIDHLLESVVGSTGKWQIKFFVLAVAVYDTAFLVLFVHLFAAFTPQHRCRVPICDDGNKESDIVNSLNEPWMEFAIPKKYFAGEFLTDGFSYDPCHTHAIVDPEGKCELANFQTDYNSSLTACQHGYVYDDSTFPETVVTKWNVVCDDQYKARLLGTMMMLGLLTGSICGGFLGDKIGRKKALLIGLFMIGPSILLAILSPNYYVYAIFKYFGSTGVMIVFVCASTILVEGFSSRHRILISCVKEITYPASQAVLAGIAFLVPHWVDYHITVGCLCLVSIPLCWMLPESYRWLAENGKQQEAFVVLKDVAKTNGKTLTKEDTNLILKTLSQIKRVSTEKHQQTKLSMFQMFSRHYFFISIVLCLTWSVVVLTSFTMNLNATKLSGDVFLNYGMVHVIEIPIQVVLFALFVKFSRLSNLLGTLLLLGICCMALIFIPKDHSTTIKIVYLIGKSSTSVQFLLIYIITSETYPTNLRSQALGFCSSIGRVFGLVTPFVSNLAVIWKPLPMLCVGLPAIIIGMLAYAVLPETFGRPLPQNMQEAVELIENKKGKSHLVPSSDIIALD